jgi:hypothetical protein
MGDMGAPQEFSQGDFRRAPEAGEEQKRQDVFLPHRSSSRFLGVSRQAMIHAAWTGGASLPLTRRMNCIFLTEGS